MGGCIGGRGGAALVDADDAGGGMARVEASEDAGLLVLVLVAALKEYRVDCDPGGPEDVGKAWCPGWGMPGSGGGSGGPSAPAPAFPYQLPAAGWPG